MAGPGRAGPVPLSGPDRVVHGLQTAGPGRNKRPAGRQVARLSWPRPGWAADALAHGGRPGLRLSPAAKAHVQLCVCECTVRVLSVWVTAHRRPARRATMKKSPESEPGISRLGSLHANLNVRQSRRPGPSRPQLRVGASSGPGRTFSSWSKPRRTIRVPDKFYSLDCAARLHGLPAGLY